VQIRQEASLVLSVSTRAMVGFLERNSFIWDQKVSDPFFQVPRKWLLKQKNLTVRQLYEEVDSHNLPAGEMERLTTIRACELSVERQEVLHRFIQAVVEFGPGPKRYGRGWENTALNLGLRPLYVDISKMVIGRVYTDLEKEMMEWLETFRGLRGKLDCYRPMLDLLKFGHTLTALEHPETIEMDFCDFRVATFYRVIPKNRPFKRNLRAAGYLLSEKVDPNGINTLAFVDPLLEFNKAAGKFGARPSVDDYLSTLRKGAGGRELELHWVKQQHPFFELAEGGKILSAFIVRAAK
jgi:hypothetical protein